MSRSLAGLRQTRPRRAAGQHRSGISESTDDDEDEEDESGALCGTTPATALGHPSQLGAADRSASIDGYVQPSGHLSNSSKSASSSGQLRALAAAAAAEVTLEAVEELKERSGDGEPLQESDVRATVVGAAAGAVPLLATEGGAGQEEPEEDIWDLLYRPARPRDDNGRASVVVRLGDPDREIQLRAYPDCSAVMVLHHEPRKLLEHHNPASQHSREVLLYSGVFSRIDYPSDTRGLPTGSVAGKYSVTLQS